MTETDRPSDVPIFDDLERRRRRREHPFVDDLTVGELEPLLGTPEPDNVPQIGEPLEPGELPAVTEAPGTGEEATEAPPLSSRVVVSAMPSTARGEQTVVAEVYGRDSGEVVARWIRSLPDPAPLCPEVNLEHELVFAIGAGELVQEDPAASWQASLYVCSRCPYAETDDATEPAPEFTEPSDETIETVARLVEERDDDPDRASELRSRKDRGGRSVEREGRDT